MKTKKPDRFERVVAKYRGRTTASFVDSEVVKLLRRQHQAVVDLIQKDIRRCKKIVAETSIPSHEHIHNHAAWTALANLLNQLKKRAT